MKKQSQYEGSQHESSSELAKSLCDLLHDCLPNNNTLQKHFTRSDCGAYKSGGGASLFWVSHHVDHVRTFLYGKHTLGICHDIQMLMPAGVLLQTRRNLGSPWAKITPCYFDIQTEEQARGMSAALQFISEYRPNLSEKVESAINTAWLHPSESDGDKTHAGAEGKRISVLVNKYERDPKNRRICIRYYHAICQACDFDFSATYGEIGAGYIHVHHLHPLAGCDGKAKTPDPIKDLRPVCPNCHEMLHRGDPLHPKTIEELKEIIKTVKDASCRLHQLSS
jgi:hypothetical protein